MQALRPRRSYAALRATWTWDALRAFLPWRSCHRTKADPFLACVYEHMLGLRIIIQRLEDQPLSDQHLQIDKRSAWTIPVSRDQTVRRQVSR